MIRKVTAMACMATLGMVAVLPVRASAQAVREPVSHRHLISGNPLLLLAEWFNAEYETKLSETTTIGASGGWLDLSKADYTSLSTFLRFYPQAAALTGFYLGARGGIHKVDLKKENRDSATFFGVGIDVGYAWLLGPASYFYVGLGIGGTRLFGGDLKGASLWIPSVRLINVGIAF